MAYKTKTGDITAGLLAEFVLAYELTDNVQFSECNNNFVCAQEVFDNTPRVQQIKRELVPIIAQLPRVQSVTIGGSNSKEKGDLLCVSVDGSRFPINLKRNNNAPERRQGQAWSNIRDTYEQLGFDMTPFRAAYVSAAKVFTAGQLRFSNSKGDWSEQLHNNADIAQSFFAHTEEQLSRQDIDPDQLVRGLQNIILGQHDSIYYTDITRGSVTRVTRGSVKLSDITLDTEVSKSGRTTRLNIYSCGKRIAYFENSVKAQAATQKQALAGGYQKSREVRSICPQTKICLCEAALDLLCDSV